MLQVIFSALNGLKWSNLRLKINRSFNHVGKRFPQMLLNLKLYNGYKMGIKQAPAVPGQTLIMLSSHYFLCRRVVPLSRHPVSQYGS